MNRRSFITKALAGLAAVPLLGRLASALPLPQSYSELVLNCKPTLFLSADSLDEAGIWRDISGNGNDYYLVTRGPAEVECVYVDGRKVFDRECSERRRKIVASVLENGPVDMSPGDFAKAFADFDHQAIEWWAEEHHLDICAHNGRFLVFGKSYPAV